MVTLKCIIVFTNQQVGLDYGKAGSCYVEVPNKGMVRLLLFDEHVLLLKCCSKLDAPSRYELLFSYMYIPHGTYN